MVKFKSNTDYIYRAQTLIQPSKSAAKSFNSVNSSCSSMFMVSPSIFNRIGYVHVCSSYCIHHCVPLVLHSSIFDQTFWIYYVNRTHMLLYILYDRIHKIKYSFKSIFDVLIFIVFLWVAWKQCSTELKGLFSCVKPKRDFEMLYCEKPYLIINARKSF